MSTQKSFFVVLGVLVCAIGAVGAYGWHVGQLRPPDAIAIPQINFLHNVPDGYTNAFVVQVVDGDTIVVRIDGDDHDETIRFLGVNTPETVDPRRPVECFGKEASAYTHTLLEGKRVRLEEDVQADNVDKYHRLLRNIFTKEKMDINASLVEQGYAYSYLSFPLDPARKQQLKKLENDARMAERGLWSPETCHGAK